MHNICIVLRGATFPAETVRVEPLERGRVAVFIKTAAPLNKGESCILRNSTNSETHCVVAELAGPPGAQVIELRCIADAAA